MLFRSLWIASAGNYRKVHYFGSFSDPDNDQWHNFSENDNYLEILNVSINDTIKIGVTWNDWKTRDKDYDFYLFFDDSGTMTVVDSSINIQNGLHYPPVEYISAGVERDGRYYIGIKRENADGQAKLNIFCTSDHKLEFISNENSYQRSIIDPAASSKALAVGAININQDIIASYSSEGPTTDGRVKPDICGPDGVSNFTVAPHFYGTSAAAPHIAGAAGLLFEQNSTRTNSDLWSFLELSVIDLGEITGKDNTYGSGILDLSLTTPVQDETISGLPGNYALGQNYPNPFNNETIIEIKIPKLTFTSLKIYDILGREVKVLVSGTLIPGTYKIRWDGKNRDNGQAASGVYFIEMKANNFRKMKKIVLLK